MSHQPVRLPSEPKGLRWALAVARSVEWQPDGNGGPNKCFTCGAYATQGHNRPCARFDAFCAAEAELHALVGGSGVAARIDALQPDSIACVVNAYRDAYETEMFTQGGIVTPRERAEQAFRDALKSVLGAVSAGGGTEP